MNEKICKKCSASFTTDMVEMQHRIITQDEEGEDVIEQFFECPVCSAHYTAAVFDRHQELARQKRLQLKAAVRNAAKAGRLQRADMYKAKEREIALNMMERAKALKEKYREYMEE